MNQTSSGDSEKGEKENGFGGALPWVSKRLEMREERRQTLKYVSRILFMGGAMGLIFVAALRLTVVSIESVH